MRNEKIYRGEIYLARLDPVVGSEQGGVRPVLIIQNNIGNFFSDTVIIAVITSHIHKSNLPTHVRLSNGYGLVKDSIVMLEQLRTVDKCRLGIRVGSLSNKDLLKVDRSLLISIGLV
ncbi:type II toxin-antitoxin system PemK/MazF family toxin [Longibaculum muris]|uniref:type II toxin-antitoxin system PemK/MazF family toxin n=1 Tax=Longibaculum muris TaxID=1796628 RepID=UPI0022E846B9|nr:type II toxin-antitoxin system PemK/MazF family toxin [Longibaculum muris]